MPPLTRRRFLAATAVAPFAATRLPADPPAQEPVAFFLVGDTHYLANRQQPREMTELSQTLNRRLVEHLNRLPGAAIDERAGGGRVATPRGVIHGGDIIDSGDKNGADYRRMQETELAAFVADYGLTGREGRLRYPVFEVYGNHDAPQGEGEVITTMRERNRARQGLMNVSENGLHSSWEWGGVHFVCLGIVVGALPEPVRRRRFNAQGSYQFLADDLRRNVGDSGKAVVITHHVDVARYSVPCNALQNANAEWDPCDVRGYHTLLQTYNIRAILHGHTHARHIFRWDGTRRDARTGIPVFNNDKSAHFNSEMQAFLYFEIGPRETVVREFRTTDRWQTGQWTPQVWRLS